MLNSNLVADIYVGDDGKLHKVQGGADSVLPFNNKKLSVLFKIAKDSNGYAVAYHRIDTSELSSITFLADSGAPYNVIYTDESVRITSCEANVPTKIDVSNYNGIMIGQTATNTISRSISIVDYEYK